MRSPGRQDEGDGAANGAEVEAANNNSTTNGAVAEPCGTGLQPQGAVSESTARIATPVSSEASEEEDGKASEDEEGTTIEDEDGNGNGNNNSAVAPRHPGLCSQGAASRLASMNASSATKKRPATPYSAKGKC